jgi:hypothetical protein
VVALVVHVEVGIDTKTNESLTFGKPVGLKRIIEGHPGTSAARVDEAGACVGLGGRTHARLFGQWRNLLGTRRCRRNVRVVRLHCVLRCCGGGLSTAFVDVIPRLRRVLRRVRGSLRTASINGLGGRNVRGLTWVARFGRRL